MVLTKVCYKDLFEVQTFFFKCFEIIHLFFIGIEHYYHFWAEV